MNPNTFTGMGGVTGIREPGKPPTVVQRDWAYALPVIFRNATILTENALQESADMHEDMEILDTIFQFFVRMYADAKKDNVTGLGGWNEFLDWVAGNGRRSEIFSMFSTYTMLNMFSYIFGSKAMAIASPDDIGGEAYNTNIFLSVLGLLDDSARQSVIAGIKKAGLLHPGINLNPMLGEAKKYLRDIKEDQEKRYRELEDKTAANN